MQMKSLISFILALLLVTACDTKTNHSGGDKETTTTGSGGAADTGGSNSINGQPIENFIINLETDSRTQIAYKNYVTVLLKNIDKSLPSFSDELRSILMPSENKRRTWYILPGSLKGLKNHTIALPAQIKTEQTALHTRTSIYFSDLSFSSLSDDLKAKHIIHEAVMAIVVDTKLWNGEKFITEEEYENIRFVTDFLFSSQLLSISSKEFSEILYSKGIHGLKNIIFPRLLDSSLQFENAKELYTFLKQRALIDSHVSYLLPHFANKDEVCSYAFNTKDRSMSIDFGDESINFKFDKIIENKKNHSSLEIVVLDFDSNNKGFATALTMTFEGDIINSFRFYRVKQVNDTSSNLVWKPYVDLNFSLTSSCHSIRMTPTGVELVDL